jgi:hypothetical protein
MATTRRRTDSGPLDLGAKRANSKLAEETGVGLPLMREALTANWTHSGDDATTQQAKTDLITANNPRGQEGPPSPIVADNRRTTPDARGLRLRLLDRTHRSAHARRRRPERRLSLPSGVHATHHGRGQPMVNLSFEEVS